MTAFSLTIIGKKKEPLTKWYQVIIQNCPQMGQSCTSCQLHGDRNLGVSGKRGPAAGIQAALPLPSARKLCRPLGQGGESTWLCSLKPKEGQQASGQFPVSTRRRPCNPSARKSGALFWTVSALYTHGTQTSMQANTHVHKINLRK